jgi:hypothetical protein
MIQEILEDGYIYYDCHDEDCGLQLRAHITDSAVAWQAAAPRTDMKNSVVFLPPCPECNSQTSVKADYVVKDLFLKMLCPVVDPETNQFYGYSMKKTHSLNFRLLNMLYEIGKLPEPPLLPVLSYEAIKSSELRGLPTVAVDSIFLAYAFCGQALTLDGVDQHIMALAGASNVTPLIQSMKQQGIQQGNVAASPEQD